MVLYTTARNGFDDHRSDASEVWRRFQSQHQPREQNGVRGATALYWKSVHRATRSPNADALGAV